MPVCRECGMPVEKATTYHPYAACLMFKACQSSEVVEANLGAVLFHGFEIGEEKEREACANVCETLRVTHGNGDPDGDEFAAAIRKRSNAKVSGAGTASAGLPG